MSFEIVNEVGEIVNSFEDEEMAKEFVDFNEEDLAVIDTTDEELIYP